MIRKLHTARIPFLTFFTLWALLAGQRLADRSPFVLVIHGGAGTITRENLTPELESAYRDQLEKILLNGYRLLSQGKPALDVVEASIKIMEDSPLFNAGKGAVFNNAGEVEMDASIMDGATLNAGAVAGVKTVKNPISAARKVMDNTWHVLLGGAGADQFAKEQGLEIRPSEYFYTERRWKSLQRVKARDAKKHGTVGCVALDRDGNLAAGTSTGGLTNKRWGRIGDSPIIGAGTYANNATCAVSGTGQGEYFIRGNVAYDVSALMEYKGMSVETAAREVIRKLTERGGDGGIIALDRTGKFAIPFNTEGMYRGYIREDGKPVVLIYKTE